MADMAMYKYLPDIDGNAYSGKRSFPIIVI
jgi:hypothetical protein